MLGNVITSIIAPCDVLVTDDSILKDEWAHMVILR